MNDLTRAKDSRRSGGFFGGDVDSLFEDFFGPITRFESKEGGNLVPAADVVDEDNQYRISAELPGIRLKDIDIFVNDGVLTINAIR